jgi:hypothetical protein
MDQMFKTTKDKIMNNKTLFTTDKINWVEISGQEIDSNDINQVVSIIDEKIPSDSEIISATITIPEVTGIINYRLNGEHLQSRF